MITKARAGLSIFAVTVAILSGTLQPALAVTVQNIVGGVTNVVFRDTFEGETLGINPTGGAPGSWQGVSGFVAVSNAAPFARQGTNYLTITRNGSAPAASAGFSSAITSGMIEAQFALYVPSSASPFTAEIGLGTIAGAAGYNGSLAWIDVPNASGQITWNDSVTAIPVTNAAGTAIMSVAKDRWQDWKLNYTIVAGANNDFYTITVDGVTSAPIAATSAGNGSHDLSTTSLSFLTFRGGNTGTFYLDAIPEPSVIGLAAVGFIGLIRLRTKNRK